MQKIFWNLSSAIWNQFKKKKRQTNLYVQTTKIVKLLDLYKGNHSFNNTIH